MEADGRGPRLDRSRSGPTGTDPVLRGVGLGWRPEIDAVVTTVRPDFSEVVAENISTMDDLPSGLVDLAARVPVVAHGVSLSLGSADPADARGIHHLQRCVERLGCPLVSEHFAFVRAGGLEAGHLLPCPKTAEAVDVFVRNIGWAQDHLDVPLAMEVIATLLPWPEDVYSDARFVTEICERTGVGFVVDVANIYANARNNGRDPLADLMQFPLERLAYGHIAGGTVQGGVYLDTHTHPVPAEVLDLAAELRFLAPQAALLLERDGDYPAPGELAAEVESIRGVMA